MGGSIRPCTQEEVQAKMDTANADIKQANADLKASWMPEVKFQLPTAVATGAAVGFGASKLFSEKEEEVKPEVVDTYNTEVVDTHNTEVVDDEQDQQPADNTDGDDQDGQTTTPSTEKPNTQFSTADKTEEGGLPGWAWALIILAILAAIGTAVYFFFFTGESEEDLEAGL